jgi:sulfate/thiosulfate transport system substrate-binding protein
LRFSWCFFSTKTTAQDALLNASYDVSRELYREINASFAADWKARTGRSVEICQAHAGSSVQARAVIDGLEADVVTFNQVTDLDALVEAKLVSKDWQTKYPYNASPCRSLMAFIVRHGNPISFFRKLPRRFLRNSAIAHFSPQSQINTGTTFSRRS